jgi:hypothetical protein
VIREYKECDLEALQRMHAESGFGYAFPNLNDPLFVSKLVVCDDDGRPTMALLARLTCEIYLLLDRKDAGASSGRERYRQMLVLHRAGERDLLNKGLEDAHAWLPPQIARRFGRRLEALGWVRDDKWAPYCRRLRE